jgi:hypothetical protein
MLSYALELCAYMSHWRRQRGCDDPKLVDLQHSGDIPRIEWL